MPTETVFHDPAYAPCHRCGYDLRATVGDTCPECGTPIGNEPSRSAIPWVHRASLGQLNAYVRTVWLATVHPARLAAEASRPQHPRDARTFAWATVIAASIPGIAMLVGYALSRDGLDLKPLMLHFGPAAVWPELVVLFSAVIGWTLFATIASGLQVYWFDLRRLPDTLRSRAVSLSRYCSAAWALVVVPLTGLAVVRVLIDLSDGGLMTPGMIGTTLTCTVAAMLLLIGVVLRSTLVVLKRVTAGRWRAMVALLFGLPALYLIAAILCLVLLPGLCLFGMLMILSLR